MLYLWIVKFIHSPCYGELFMDAATRSLWGVKKYKSVHILHEDEDRLQIWKTSLP